MSSKSFGKDIYDLPTIKESVAEFGGVCGSKLRARTVVPPQFMAKLHNGGKNPQRMPMILSQEESR